MSDSTTPDNSQRGGTKERGPVHRIAPRLLASLIIAAGFAWALKRGGLPFAPPQGAFSELRWWGLPAFAVLMLVSIVLRTNRWLYLLRPISKELPRWRIFGIGLIAYSAVFFAPLRLGEVVRPYLIAQDGEVSFVQAVGTVAAERIIDGLIMVLLTAAAFGISSPVIPLPDHVGALPIPVSLVPRALAIAAGIFSLAFLAMALVYSTRDTARRVIRSTLGRVSAQLAELCGRQLERLAQGFGFLPSWSSSRPFLRDTLLYWGFNAAAQWALLLGVGLTPSPAEAFVTLGVIGLGSLLPAGPGFFGAYQLATYTALAMYFGEQAVLGQGALFVFVSYITLVVLSALAGGAGFVLLSKYPARSVLHAL